jgi:hypothetical protein
LKPIGSKRAKTGGNEKEKNTKAMDGDKKSWKARFVELEAKMAAMSATTNSGGPKPHDTPSFHAGGGSLSDDEDFERFMLSGMAITAADSLEENPILHNRLNNYCLSLMTKVQLQPSV